MLGNYVQNYTPTKHPVNAFKATCRLAARQAFTGPPLQGPLAVSLVFVMPRPQSMVYKKRPMPRVPHDKKPDEDNLTKATYDALKGLLFVDDCQIFRAWKEKWIAAGDEAPHVEVRIEQVSP